MLDKAFGQEKKRSATHAGTRLGLRTAKGSKGWPPGLAIDRWRLATIALANLQRRDRCTRRFDSTLLAIHFLERDECPTRSLTCLSRCKKKSTNPLPHLSRFKQKRHTNMTAKCFLRKKQMPSRMLQMSSGVYSRKSRIPLGRACG
jgi:hypothetical protein